MNKIKIEGLLVICKTEINRNIFPMITMRKIASRHVVLTQQPLWGGCCLHGELSASEIKNT